MLAVLISVVHQVICDSRIVTLANSIYDILVLYLTSFPSAAQLPILQGYAQGLLAAGAQHPARVRREPGGHLRAGHRQGERLLVLHCLKMLDLTSP